MGRRKADHPLGTLRLIVPAKADRNKEYAIAYEYLWNREAIRKRTGFYAKFADWNAEARELRASFGNRYKEINNLLADNIARYDIEVAKFKSKHPERPLTCEDIRNILFDAPLSRDDEGRDFIDFTLENLKSRLNTNRIKRSRYENGVSSLNGFRKYLLAEKKGTYKPDGIYVGEVSPELIEGYIEYRRNVLGNKDATINHTLTPIFKSLEEARDRGYISNGACALVQKLRIIEDNAVSLEETAESFNGKFLRENELRALLDYYALDSEPRRKEFIEMFLFAFHAGGLRLVDVMTLRWSDVDFKKTELSKYLVKTKKTTKGRHVVPLTLPAITILEQWKHKTEGNKFVFNLCKEDLNIDDAQALYKARNNADKCVNQALKVVGENLIIKEDNGNEHKGLPFTLSFHCARHTFAMLALNASNSGKRLSMHVVSRLLGHASTATTEKTYAKYLPETLREEMESLDFNFVPDHFNQ